MSPNERKKINKLIKKLKEMTIPERVKFLKTLGYNAYGKDADLAKYLDVFDEKDKTSETLNI